MKKKIILLCTFVILLSISTRAQTLSPMVISSSGGYYASGSTTLSFTVAEMTMVQTFIQSASILTQGFQQPEQLTTGIAKNDLTQGEIVIFPNPTDGLFSVGFSVKDDALFQIRIYNMVGQIVFKQSYDAIAGSKIIDFDIREWKQGVYFLELSSTLKGKNFQSIQKINLVY